jgi:hypothetical protein
VIATGDCVLQTDGDGIVVVQADPRVLIAGELHDLMREGRGLHRCVTLDGDLLRIRAKNRTVIYRVGEYIPERRAYFAEWPD